LENQKEAVEMKDNTAIQVRSMLELTHQIAQKSGTSLQPRHVEAAMKRDDMKKELFQLILKHQTLETGMSLPIAAEATRLLLHGMEVVSDDLVTEINLSQLDFSHHLFKEGEKHIESASIIPRADECGAVGGLWLARLLLDISGTSTEELHKIIPLKRSRLSHREPVEASVILLPRTVVRRYGKEDYIPYLSWGNAGWGDFSLQWFNIGGYTYNADYRFATAKKT